MTKIQNNSPRKIPLLIVLVASYVSLNVLAVGLVGYISYRNGQDAVNDVANQLRNETSKRIEAHLYTFLSTPHQINQNNANLLRQEFIEVHDAASLETLFWEQIQVFDSVSSIYFGNTEGGLANAGREGAEGELYVIATDNFAHGALTKYATDDKGERTDLLVTVPDFDARTRPWYIGAVNNEGAAWSDPYILFTGQDMAISASHPVYMEQELQGVVAVDLFLSHLSVFLQSLDIGETGQAFIMDRSGLLIASSSAEKPFSEPDETGVRQRLYARESTIPLIHYAAEALEKRIDNYDDISETQNWEFELDGERHFLQLSSIKNEEGLDWLVVVVVPEAEFMAQINANNQITLLLIFVTLIISVFVGIIATQKIIRPILQINRRAYAISEGEWGEPIAHDSRIREISAMTQSLNHMATQLQQMVANLTTEINERKQAEEALRLSQVYYQTLFNESPAPLWEEEFSELFIYLDELKESGVHDFRAYFDNNPDELLVCAEKIKILEVNQATLSLHQAENKAQLLKRLDTTFTANSFPVFKEEVIALASGAVEFTSEIEVQTLTGELRTVALRLIINKDQPDSTRALLVTTDVTAQKQAEGERLRLDKLQSLGVLAGGIAHDFNNLLTGLYGNLELAKLVISADHKAQKYLTVAERSMNNAVKLTSQLLTFAKGGEPIKETIALGEMIEEAAEFSLRGSHVKLKNNIASDLWLVDADKGQLHQVISNLVINAQQAMPTGGTVTITAVNINSENGKQVKIAIEDEGAGIAPQYLDKIFDPYFSTKQKGSGLGLASSYSIINKHNGRIQVSSQLNQGTTFTIYLPAIEKATTEQPLDKTDNNHNFAAKILLLDDEEIIRETVGDMLAAMGHQFEFAIDGQEAIAKYAAAFASNGGYDLVIADLTIPGGMGGEEAAQEILKINPQAKLIVSSGYATDPIMANYKEYGFSGIVIKPYRLADLKKAIEQLL